MSCRETGLLRKAKGLFSRQPFFFIEGSMPFGERFRKA